MKYSIRGTIHNTEGESIAPVLQSYTAWRLVMENSWDDGSFIFEIWLSTSEESGSLFEELKPYIDEYGGSIDWHVCTHDQRIKEPCTIEETYSVGG